MVAEQVEREGQRKRRKPVEVLLLEWRAGLHEIARLPLAVFSRGPWSWHKTNQSHHRQALDFAGIHAAFSATAAAASFSISPTLQPPRIVGVLLVSGNEIDQSV